MEVEKKQKELSVEQGQEESKMLATTKQPKNNSTVWMFAISSFVMGIVAFGVWIFSRKR